MTRKLTRKIRRAEKKAINEHIAKFPSMIQAAKGMGISHNTLRRLAAGKNSEGANRFRASSIKQALEAISWDQPTAQEEQEPEQAKPPILLQALTEALRSHTGNGAGGKGLAKVIAILMELKKDQEGMQRQASQNHQQLQVVGAAVAELIKQMDSFLRAWGVEA